MSFEPRDYLSHILAEANYLVEQSERSSWEVFSSDATLQRAFVRSLEVIGEAVKKLPQDFCAEHPAVDWKRIARMRDRLIHGYFGVDYQLVWEVVRTKVPELQAYVSALLHEP